MTEEAKLISDFITANFDKIVSLGKLAYNKAGNEIQLKLKTAYKSYLVEVKKKYSKSRSFFISSTSVDLYSYYVPIGISNFVNSIEDPTIDRCLAHSTRNIITGTGGSGKSVLMKHLFLDCITSKNHVPIMIELRDFNNTTFTLTDFIYNTLLDFGLDCSSNYYESALKQGHFCIFLDGYDELTRHARQELSAQLRSFERRYAKCPIFISSRPDDTFNSYSDFDSYEIQPLSLESAKNLVKKLPFQEETKKKFIIALEENLFTEHESFLSNPLLLSIMLLTYGESAEIPSKMSIFYGKAFEALFYKHDALKGAYRREKLTKLDIQEFTRIFSLFCLQTYDRRIFRFTKTECIKFTKKSRAFFGKDFSDEDFITDLTSAVCLLIEDGLELAFTHRSFQEYFVAVHIVNSPPDIQKKLIDRYFENAPFDSIFSLLIELNPEMIERTLIIPQLESLFSELKVTNKVTAIHTVRYVKKFFTQLEASVHGIQASLNLNNMPLRTLQSTINTHYAFYTYPSESWFHEEEEKLIEEFDLSNNNASFSTKNFSTKHVLAKYTIFSEGTMSINFLSGLHKLYLKLKHKQESTQQNLDNLLNN